MAKQLFCVAALLSSGVALRAEVFSLTRSLVGAPAVANFAIVRVPEPSTLLLLLTTGAAVWLVARKRFQ